MYFLCDCSLKFIIYVEPSVFTSEALHKKVLNFVKLLKSSIEDLMADIKTECRQDLFRRNVFIVCQEFFSPQQQSFPCSDWTVAIYLSTCSIGPPWTCSVATFKPRLVIRLSFFNRFSTATMLASFAATHYEKLLSRNLISFNSIYSTMNSTYNILQASQIFRVKQLKDFR